jgi:predicted exporter
MRSICYQYRAGSTPRKLQRIWPTLRLGMLTSAFGFGAMLFSDFRSFSA